MEVHRGPTALARLINGLAEPTRRSLYDAVRRARRPMSRADAAAATGVNARLAAFHLDRLVDEGLLVAHFARPAHRRGGPGAGRPTKWYTASRVGLDVTVPPRRNDVAARVLLAAVLRRDDAAADMCAAARETGAGLAEHCRGDDGLESLLVTLGYEPQAREGGLDLQNCPFHELAEQAREPVCSMNLALLQGAAEVAGATRAPRLEPRPGHCCVRLVDPRSPRAQAGG
jgi:predicted ArsR family transcriptional regulator